MLEFRYSFAVADFYQGRSSVSIGNRHYLDKERMADEKYQLLIHIFFKKGRDNVDKTKPVVGTIELISGFGN
ncbi:hypothetical protein HOC01_00165 [archaeon]|jgi:intergrase/recombinase|nr:hypothetical protein [archaeon]MBT6698745.1 hypothetical protein [archaeon]